MENDTPPAGTTETPALAATTNDNTPSSTPPAPAAQDVTGLPDWARRIKLSDFVLFQA